MEVAFEETYPPEIRPQDGSSHNMRIRRNCLTFKVLFEIIICYFLRQIPRRNTMLVFLVFIGSILKQKLNYDASPL